MLIADDQQLVRTGFRMILDSEPDIDGCRRSHRRTYTPCRSPTNCSPTSCSWTSGCRASTASKPPADSPPIGSSQHSKVLILTTFDLDEYVFDALRAGASGFLLKDTPATQLTAAIRMISAGDALLAPTITRRLIEEFTTRTRALPPPPGLDELTARELDVFRLVARGMSNAEIATELVIGETTVKTHVTRLLMKLGLRDRVQAVVLAYEAGIINPRQPN